MEDKPERGRKYLICFKEGQNWKEVFSKYPEERKRIKKAFLEAKNTWKVAFNERRIERAVKSVYNPFTSEIKMTGDDYRLYMNNSYPLFIVNDNTLLDL